MHPQKIVSTLTAFTLFTISYECFAQQESFTTRDEFDLATSTLPIQVEGWDNLESNTLIANGSVISGNTYSLSDPDNDETLATVTGVNMISTPNTLGTLDSTTDTFSGIDPESTLRIEFSEPITAWGVWISTADTLPGSILAETSTGESALSGLDPHPPGFEFGQFVGLVSDTPFDSIEISSTRDDNSYVLDDMRYAGLETPELLLMTSFIDFGDQPLGVPSAAQTVMAMNIGPADLIFDLLELTGPHPDDYMIGFDDCSLATLATDEACEVEIGFAPLAPGIRSAEVAVPSNDPSGPHAVELLGTNDVLFFDGFED